MKLFYIAIIVMPIYCYSDEDWIDPNDPSPKKTLSLAVSDFCHSKQLQCTEDPSLRLILRRIFQRINVDPLQKAYFSRTARLSLSSYNMAVIAEYLEAETEDISQRELVRSALHNMIEMIPDDNVSILESILTFLWPWVVMCNFIVLPPAIFFVLRSIMSTRSFWISVLSTFILLSMVTTYNRMYQEKVAARIAAATEMQGDACAPAGLIEQGLDFLGGLVWIKRKSPCLKYIESQTVSIVSEISLLDVFSDVLSNGLFGWLSTLGPHLNKFYRGLFDGIPLPMQLLIFLSMFFLFVRIKTPLFTMEPMMVTMLGNIFTTVTNVIARNDHSPQALNYRTEGISNAENKEKFNNVTQRTPERRLTERKRREKMAIKAAREESDSDVASISSINSLTNRDRSISRTRREVD